MRSPISYLQDSRRRNQKIREPRWKPLLRSFELRLRLALSSPLGLLLRPIRSDRKLKLDEIDSVLILRYDAIGDVILSTPVWRSIKKYAPHIRIGVVASERNRALLDADPDVDDVFVFTRTFSMQDLRELRKARRIKWSAVIGLFFSDKTISAIYAKLAAPHGVSSTIVRGALDKYRNIYGLVGERAQYHPLVPMSEQIMLAATTLLDIPLSEADRKPSIKYPAQWDEAADVALRSLLGPAQPFIVLNTDAAAQFRDWGLQNCLEFSRLVAQDFPELKVLWTSAPSRAATVKSFLSNHNAPNSLYFESPSVLMLVAAISKAKAVVSPDTSVVHMADALARPLVGLYWEKNEFLPQFTRFTLLLTPNRIAISNITPEEVFAAFKVLIGRDNQ